MTEKRSSSARIRYERRRSRSQKYVTIRVSPSKAVTVLAPEGIADPEIDILVAKQETWIAEKLQRIDEVVKPSEAREFVSGEGFLFKGKLLRLKVLLVRETNEEGVHSDTTTLQCRVRSASEEHVKKALRDWYKDQANTYLPLRVERMATQLGVLPTGCGLRDQTRRWGSCTNGGKVLINWRIIMAPISVIDYVVAHELAHLKNKPHSPQFWDAVKAAIPRYEVQREWLRVNGPSLTLDADSTSPGRRLR